MKYLKSINEAYNLNIIKEFCEDHLAYLTDKDFIIKVLDRRIKWEQIPVIEISNDTKFCWSDIKDTMIPFLTILREEFNVQHNVCFTQKEDYHVEYPVDFKMKIYQLTKDYNINDKPFNKIEILLHSNQNNFRKKKNLDL